jgi:Tfp pilus assembly protein PilN
MTEVNLLPPEFRRRHRSRALTRQVVMVAAAALLLLIVVFVYESSRLSSAQDELAAQNAHNAELTAQISNLQRYANLQTELTTKKELVTDLEQGVVQWSGVLHDLSMVMPSDVYLTSMTGQITLGPGGWETSASASNLIGVMQFQGVALNFPNVALWIDKLVDVDGWANAWVTTAAASSNSEGQSQGQSQSQQSQSVQGVQFNGTVDLTPESAENGTAP